MKESIAASNLNAQNWKASLMPVDSNATRRIFTKCTGLWSSSTHMQATTVLMEGSHSRGKRISQTIYNGNISRRTPLPTKPTAPSLLALSWRGNESWLLLELQLPWLDHNCLVWNTRVTDSLEYCLVWNTGVSDSLEYCLVWNIGVTVVPDYCLFQNTTITVLECRSDRDLRSPRVFCIHPIVYI
jgi:hypothetical protein